MDTVILLILVIAAVAYAFRHFAKAVTKTHDAHKVVCHTTQGYLYSQYDTKDSEDVTVLCSYRTDNPHAVNIFYIGGPTLSDVHSTKASITMPRTALYLMVNGNYADGVQVPLADGITAHFSTHVTMRKQNVRDVHFNFASPFGGQKSLCVPHKQLTKYLDLTFQKVPFGQESSSADAV